MWRSRIFWRLFAALSVIAAISLGLLGWGVATAIAGALAAVLVMSIFLTRSLTASLKELTEAAKAMAGGNYGRRVGATANDEIGELAAAFNEMSQACASEIARMDQDRARLQAMFRGMAEGVLVIDHDQGIQFLNDAAGRLLGVSADTVNEGQKLWQVNRNRQLGAAVERVLASAEPHVCEVELPAVSGERLVVSSKETNATTHHSLLTTHYSLHGTRLPGTPSPGAVLVFHNMTHLRRLERVRQDFVANVSHELKTPLATIQATVETLLDGAVNDPNYNLTFLQRIRESAERLHRLVQDLLTLGRIESGEEIMELQPVSVQTAVESCVSRQENRAVAKQLRLHTVPSTEALAVFADEEALAVILDNLVDNAIKYTPAGGQITLRWFSEDSAAVIQVQDTGFGIPEKDQPRIFERFYRVDKARSRQLGGTGLGLSIVKHFVQALNGNISVASRPNEGSTFSLRLPVAAEAGSRGR